MRVFKNKLMHSLLPMLVVVMGVGCSEEENNSDCPSLDCENISVKSTHSNVKARIYDRSDVESDVPDFVIVYSKQFVETGTSNHYDSIISPCEPLPVQFQQDGFLVNISFELLDCCNLFTHRIANNIEYGCRANILEINHLEDEN